MLQRITLALIAFAVAGCAAPSTTPSITDDATYSFEDQGQTCVPGGGMQIIEGEGGRVEHITIVGPAVVRTSEGVVLVDVPAGETVSGAFDDGQFHPDPVDDGARVFGFGLEVPF